MCEPEGGLGLSREQGLKEVRQVLWTELNDVRGQARACIWLRGTNTEGTPGGNALFPRSRDSRAYMELLLHAGEG